LEQSYRLPFSQSPKFPQLFDSLEARKQELGIDSYGIGVTTIEEVFLRVERDSERQAAIDSGEAKTNAEAESVPMAVPVEELKEAYPEEGRSTFEIEREPSCYPRYSEAKIAPRKGLHGFFVHFAALSRKRMLSARRDKRMFCCQLVIPTILVLLGLGLLQLQPDENLPDLRLTPNFQNPDLPKQQRNPVPMNAMSSLGAAIQSRFNNDDIPGYAVPMEPTPDRFEGCAQGAEPLHELSNYLIESEGDHDEHGASRYGAITISENSTLTNLQYNVMVNGSSIHGAAIYPNLIHTALLQEALQNSSVRIVINSHPLPRTVRQNEQSASFSALTVALFLSIAFAFIPAGFAVFVVREREVKAKHLQLVSGVSLPAYWLSTFIWDYTTYLVSAGMAIGLIYAFEVDAFTHNAGAIAIVLVFVCFGPALAAFTYVLTFAFTTYSTAQNVVLFINFITGLCLMVVVFVLTLLQLTVEESRIMRYAFRIFLPYCFGDALLYIATCQDGTRCPRLGSDGFQSTDFISPFNLDIALADIIFLVIMTFVYLALVFVIENTPADFGLLPQDPRKILRAALSFGTRRRSDSHSSIEQEEDSDVAQERTRVLSGEAANDVVQLFELMKVYDKTKAAVKPLSFGVHHGECFGFLGTNGAGKTTALSILSGDQAPTSGTATIAGYDILKESKGVRHKIGYCPQFDALFDLLTVQEHLQLYATIKGIPPDVLEQETHYLTKSLELQNHVKKQARQLSGGNRRKLSVAIALLGRPPVVFLDEPSSGTV
jgi:ATP-binding cassette subfamily A (ABC1) protein 3